MKKFRLLFSVVVMGLFTINGFAQTIADIGVDYDGTNDVASTSGLTLVNGVDGEGQSVTYVANDAPLNYLVYKGTENELSIITDNVSNVLLHETTNGVYNSGTYLNIYIKGNQTTNNIECSLTSASSNKSISAVKINGTDYSGNGSTFASVAVLFSDEIPFNSTRVIGYDAKELATRRVGNSGVTFAAPVGTKSFRIYKQVGLKESAEEGIYEMVNSTTNIVVGNNNNNLRIAYIAATIAPDTPTSINDNVSNDNKVILKKSLIDLSGRSVAEGTKGILIQKTTFVDGSVSFEKVIITK